MSLLKKSCLIPIFGLAAAIAAAAEPTASDRELAGSLRGLYRTLPEEHAARYAIDEIAGRFWHSLELERLEGKAPATVEQLDAARRILGEIRAEFDKGVRWSFKPPRLTLPKLKTPPAIDGEITPSEWGTALVLTGEYPLETTARNQIGSRWYLGYDEEALYFALVCPETPVAFYNGAAGEPAPWEGDAFELFILPDPRLFCYREIVANPNGCVYTALNTRRNGEAHINSNPESTAPYQARGKRPAAGGWIVELKVPFRELPGYFRGNSPRPGETLRLALLRTRAGKIFTAYPLLYNGHNTHGYATFSLE